MRRDGVSRGPQLGILLLLYQIVAQIGVLNIPPITLVTIVTQVSIVLGFLDFGWSRMPPSAICLSGNAILNHHEFYRILTAQVTHASDFHLYYNMISMAWKGMTLERRYGSLVFGLLLAVVTVSTGFVYAFLAQLASELLRDPKYLSECSVGFSGVLFALKVLVNHHRPDEEMHNFGLFSLPKNLAVWGELLLIQLIVPNASFLGHLSGVVVGVIFLQILSAFQIVTLSVTKLMTSPGTTVLATLIAALHFEWIPKPWSQTSFWSSHSHRFCLSCSHIIDGHDFMRLLSGPLEHSGVFHFFICFVSICFKLYQLESRRSCARLILLSIQSMLSTSLVFVVISYFATKISGDRFFEDECHQGLTGTCFALKVLVLAETTKRFWSPLFLFEIVELLLLLEQRTFIFHLSGIIVGILIYFFNHWRKFPGIGITLGRPDPQQYEPWTRSWGYGRRPRPSYSSVDISSARAMPSSRPKSGTEDATQYPPPPSEGGYYLDSDRSWTPEPDLEEVRRRRLFRFS